MPVLLVVEATTAGVKRHVLSLVSRLDRQRFSVAVACPPVRSAAYGDTSFVSDLARHDIRVHVVDMHHTLHPVIDTRAIAVLTRLLQRHDYPIVHAHSSKAGIVGRIAARLARVPVVVYTPNAFAFNRFSPGLRRWAYTQAERWLARWTDLIICSSEGERGLAREAGIGGPQQLVVIENAIDVAELQVSVDVAVQRRRLGLSPDAPVVGTLGRLSPQKGLRYLIEAVPNVLEQAPATQFVIVGDGELRSSLERHAQALGVADHCFFLGYRSDAPEIMTTFDVFALPSLYEAGVPFAILEAMALEVPVVTTRAPGLEALRHGETGLLVPPQDAGALAEAILHLVTDSGLAAALARRSRGWVETDFSLAEKVRQIEAEYERLLARKTARAIRSRELVS